MLQMLVLLQLPQEVSLLTEPVVLRSLVLLLRCKVLLVVLLWLLHQLLSCRQLAPWRPK